MNRNIRIAKQLIGLAKDLLMDTNITVTNDGSKESNYSINYAMNGNIANKPGKYNNFSGHIDWKNINGWVENAIFELNEGTISITFEKGTVKS